MVKKKKPTLLAKTNASVLRKWIEAQDPFPIVSICLKIIEFPWKRAYPVK